ncbi:hypothetical protein [Desulfofustis glycolicus]|uniref:AhpC/TSA family protein n=1 Tax=Desulfofustis glycolicus DSM 9705 TaxID=1121409 RepID=A0A1M5RZR6_9BACT|nr:hypothetical protein [Desulfofustis glycolicus]MCB2216299.1 hypothetical protein [Desulfobulbaceae bacterium]SHH31685.1 hypothetical protein SAMN02745124_00085 [Desulfofustis glycolicus DSM 9705]
MTSLQQQLQTIREKSAEKLTPDVRAAIQQGFAELQESVVREKVLGVGDTAPPFSLPDTRGKCIVSDALLAEGPLVILFYRGKW